MLTSNWYVLLYVYLYLVIFNILINNMQMNINLNINIPSKTVKNDYFMNRIICNII